jgi:Yippee zinc-binding/DNA-binding /Mis18, centromere assembly
MMPSTKNKTKTDPSSPRNQQHRRSSSAASMEESVSSAGTLPSAAAAAGASPLSSATASASAPGAHLSYQREPAPHNQQQHHHHRRLASPRVSFLEAGNSNSNNNNGLSSPSIHSIHITGSNSPGAGEGRASPLILPPPSSVQAQSQSPLPLSPRGMSARRFLRAAFHNNNYSSSNEEAKASSIAGAAASSPGSNRSGRRCVRSALAGGNIKMNHHRHQHQHEADDDDDDSKFHHRTLASNALAVNDAMVYLDGPRVYACQNCRTHLTSHDDIISKSFHGRHGRAYLFDVCVNVTIGPAEDRMLITGLHSVCDIFCKRCQKCVGWTYQKAYEASQKYKEGKFIIEKINLYLEDNSGFYQGIEPPAGERQDKWRKRSTSWGSEAECATPPGGGGSGLVASGSPYNGQHHHHHRSHSYSHSHSHSLDQPSPGGRSAASTASSLIYEYRPASSAAEDGVSSLSASAAVPARAPSLPL